MGWGRVNQRRLRAGRRLEKGWPNPFPRARLYQRALEVEGSYGKVAQRFGVTREEVCHYVTLVRRLPAELIVAVEVDLHPHVQRRLSLRALLRIARLDDARQQRAAFGRLVARPASIGSQVSRAR